MIFGRTYDADRDGMPQTVPTSGQSPSQQSPPQYSFTADSFDLSLLPPDGEVPVSPPSLRHLVQLLGGPATSPPPPMFSPQRGDDCVKSDRHLADFDFPTTILEDNIPQLKTIPSFKTEISRTNQYQNDSTTLLFDQFQNFGYQSPVYPTPSPSSDEGSIPTFSIQPCSPYDTSNLTYSPSNSYSSYLTVKQEPNTLLSPQYSAGSPYPHSPASTAASYSNHSSPHYAQPVSPPQFGSHTIKDEAAIDIEEFLKENQILQDQLSYSQLKNQSDQRLPNYEQSLLVPKEEPFAKPKDHQLLREVLQDTSFQKRFNLRPLNFDSLTSSFTPLTNLTIKMEEPEGMSSASDTLMTSCSSALAREKIEPVLSLAIEQMRKDVDNTCSALGISPDPVQWSGEDVKAWVLWTLRQYSLPLVPVEYFGMDGARLAALTEQDFVQRAPQAGSTLYAQLEIWKAARQEGSSASGTSSTPGPWGSAPSTSTLSSNEEATDDEEEEVAPEVQSPGSSTAGKSKQGGSHIHLWQFLKELLASPQLHGSAIRWLDRGKGVFKIEDSVRVARLWGKRKNRPAMNYDKLSRSIRQYYKKGIMKKTERSQRLVYQFCHPYCL